MKHNLPSLITTALLFFCALTGFAQDFWEVLNTPAGYGVNSLAINSDEDIFVGFATSSGGGVFRKLNNGNSWDTSLFFSNNLIGEIYIDKSDNIFAARDELYFSNNNGANWNLVFNQIMGINSIYRSSDNSTFFGFWGGIYKSDSINSNWAQVLSLDNVEVVNAIIEDTISGILYAGTTHYFGGGGVYRSIDGGNTWEHFGLTDCHVSSLALNSSGDLFAGSRGGGESYPFNCGVFKLSNGQTEWINVNNAELVTSMVINSKDEIYIGCSDLDEYTGGVRRSMDNGQTWESINSGMGNQDIENMVIGHGGHLYAGAYNSSTPLFISVNSIVTSDFDGTITYANVAGTPLSNVHINLLQQDSLIGETNTNAYGHYHFNDINNGVYTMILSTTKPWGGVTASDVLSYRKYIANISSLNGIYLDSGDVNGSGDVTAADVLLIRKRIAHLIDAFPAGDWLFNNQPVMITTFHMTYNFSGICYGDVNGSYVPTAK